MTLQGQNITYRVVGASDAIHCRAVMNQSNKHAMQVLHHHMWCNSSYNKFSVCDSDRTLLPCVEATQPICLRRTCFRRASGDLYLLIKLEGPALERQRAIFKEEQRAAQAATQAQDVTRARSPTPLQSPSEIGEGARHWIMGARCRLR